MYFFHMGRVNLLNNECQKMPLFCPTYDCCFKYVWDSGLKNNFFLNNFIKILVDCVLVLRFIDEKNCDTLILKELFFLKCLENGLGFNNCYVKVKVLVMSDSLRSHGL